MRIYELNEDDPTAPAVDWLLALKDQETKRPKRSKPGKGAGDRVLDPKDNRKSQVDWRAQLIGVVRSTVSTSPGTDDFSYAMPLNESMLYGTVVPGLAKTEPNIALIFDTSSSMGEGRQAQVAAELAAILRRVESGVTVLSVDTALHTMRRVFHSRELYVIGGGGTDMRIGIKEAVRSGEQYDLIIVATDGDTPWPERPPPIPVIC